MDIKRSYQLESGGTLTAQKVCQLINDGRISDLPVNLLSINSNGASTSLNTDNSTISLSSVLLDATHVLVAYRGASNYLYAVVLTINGTTISSGANLQVNSTSSNYITACALDSTHVLVAFCSGSSTWLSSIVLTVSGTTITAGSASTISNVWPQSITVSSTDSTHGVISFMDYTDSPYPLKSVVASVSGTTITYGAVYTFLSNGAASAYLSSISIDSTHVLVSYSASTFSVTILTLNGTTLTSGTALQLGTSSMYQSLTKLDSTHIVVVYSDSGTIPYPVDAIVLTISGTTITAGTKLVLNNVYSNYVVSAILDSTHVMVAYQNNISTYMEALILKINGTNITSSSILAVTNTKATYISLSTLDSTHVLASFTGSTGYLSGLMLTANLSEGKALGVSQDNVGTVMLKGISRGHTGLTAGSAYYFDSNGTLSTTNTGTFIGYAISASELLIPDYIIS